MIALDILLFWLFTAVRFDCGRHRAGRETPQQTKIALCGTCQTHDLDIFSHWMAAWLESVIQTCRTVRQLVHNLYYSFSFFFFWFGRCGEEKILQITSFIATKRLHHHHPHLIRRTGCSRSSLLLIECLMAIAAQTMKNGIARFEINNRNFLIDYHIIAFYWCICVVYAC